ncbi:MAG: hypothetical protein OXH70_17355 [Acidobacteria bacterium]|nr:hypothetical protein [Acidobacteriota bacterium]
MTLDEGAIRGGVCGEPFLCPLALSVVHLWFVNDDCRPHVKGDCHFVNEEGNVIGAYRMSARARHFIDEFDSMSEMSKEDAESKLDALVDLWAGKTFRFTLRPPGGPGRHRPSSFTLTKEESNDPDAIIFSGRTDGPEARGGIDSPGLHSSSEVSSPAPIQGSVLFQKGVTG